jgi:dihydrofolate reductase
MSHVTYFAAMSLDGRIAGPNNDLTFLNTLKGAFPDGEYNVWTVIDGFDSIIVGATTFRVIVHEIEEGKYERWPYGDKPVWVMTHARELPQVRGATNLRLFSGDPQEACRRSPGSTCRGRGYWEEAISPASFSMPI